MKLEQLSALGALVHFSGMPPATAYQLVDRAGIEFAREINTVARDCEGRTAPEIADALYGVIEPRLQANPDLIDRPKADEAPPQDPSADRLTDDGAPPAQ